MQFPVFNMVGRGDWQNLLGSLNPTLMSCEICKNESGGTDVGVASIPGVPMSIMWCSECLKRDCAPTFVFEHDYIFVANGDLGALNEWSKQRETWADGRYMTFTEYVQRITPEEVFQQQQEFEEACRLPPAEDWEQPSLVEGEERKK